MSSRECAPAAAASVPRRPRRGSIAAGTDRPNAAPCRLVALLALLAQSAFAQSATPEQLMEAGHWKRARAMVAPMLAANPNGARELLLASRVKLAFHDLDAAVKLGERAAAAGPRNVEPQHQLAEAYGTIANEAPIWRQLGPGRKCKSAMDAAHALDPNHIPTMMILMQYYHRAPGFMGGDKKKVADLVQRIESVDPVRGRIARAAHALLVNDAAAAERHYRDAVKSAPGSYGARMELARFLAGRRDWTGVREHAEAAAKLHPDRGEPRSLLARAAAWSGDMARLEAVLADAATSVPDDRSPCYWAAAALIERRAEPARARQLLETYLAQEAEGGAPSHADARKLLGKVR